MNSISASCERTYAVIYTMISNPIYDIRALFYDMIRTHRYYNRIRKYDSYKELKRILSQLKKNYVGSTFNFSLFNCNYWGDTIDVSITFTTELYDGKKIITSSVEHRYEDEDDDDWTSDWIPDGDTPKSEREALYYVVEWMEESGCQRNTFDFAKGIFWIRHPMINLAELVAPIDESNKSLD